MGDRIIAPPPSIEAGANATNQATKTIAYLAALQEQVAAEDRLAASWVAAQMWRVEAYRALGVLPFDEWDAFLASFRSAGK